MAHARARKTPLSEDKQAAADPVGASSDFPLMILAIKAYSEGWFKPHYTLDLHQQPALLFFNRQKGCECAISVYKTAHSQVRNWSGDDRHGMQIIEFDLDRWPGTDIGEQFDVIRAPTLLLLDGAGEIVYRQDDTVADTAPLDLPVFEEKIVEVLDGE